MPEQKFIKSEQGAKAAWKGFSSQTTYIAHRIMFLNDNSEFFPEEVEDLLIQKNGVPVELIQVKNLTADLSLSSLAPTKEDSFFQRCLEYRMQNPNIILRVASFGNIGPELQGVMDDLKDTKDLVASKLLKHGYLTNDINWLLKHLLIEKVDEEKLLSDIIEKLETTIESIAAPHVVLDMLCRYVSQLSRVGGHTTRDIWQAKLQSFGLNLASLTGVVRQYGNTLIPLYEYSANDSKKTLQREYLEGINALPQHIRFNLDVERAFWLEKIENAFNNKNIVIIRGASGQGKSSLAYRFLLNNYSETDVICVEKITSEEQAIDVRSALSGITKNRSTPIIAYLDVAPYDTNWLWLCEKLCAQSTEIRLLITIREEDFRRTAIDYAKLSFAEIELFFGKEEAAELFQLYTEHDFLSFDDAWRSFGEKGPLLEFTYMLNQSETLKDRLSSQIKRITQNESDSDEWLRALSIISYAGRGNVQIDIMKLFSVIKCPHQRKMLDIFEKEYFLRTVNHGRCIEPLHALRATIIYDILKDEALFPEAKILTAALSSSNENALMLVVSYIYENGISNKITDELSRIKYNTWTLYASVLKALLWAEVFAYYQKNRDIINEGNSLTNNSFPILFQGDISGYYNKVDFSSFIDLLENKRPGIIKEVEGVLDKLSSRTIEYSYVDRFIQSTLDNLPVGITQEYELTSAGYSLFWLAKRGYFITEEKCPFVYDASVNSKWLEDYLNFLVGVQAQQWDSVYTPLYNFLKSQLINKYSLVLYEDSSDELFATAIIDILDEDEHQQLSNTYIMSIVEAMRRLCSYKKKYNIEIVGYNIIEGVVMPSLEKHILADKLPWVWITQLNGWFNKLSEYYLYPEHWDICLRNIVNIRKNIIQIAKETINGMDYLYSKRNIKKLIQDEHRKLMLEIKKCVNDSHAFIPQSKFDKYGIHSNNAIVQDMSSNFDMQKGGKEQSGFQKNFQKYCASFDNYLNQRDELIINKIEGNEPSQIARLSLINLIDALDELPAMQMAFEQEFALKEVSVDCNDEYQQLLVLSGVWSYFYAHSFHVEKTVAYSQKEYIKKYRRRIDDFFQIDIAQYESVISVQFADRTIVVIVEVEKVDSFCSQIFDDMKETFPEIATLTLEGFLWSEYVDRIDIQISVWGDVISGGYTIPTKHFKIYDDKEAFLKHITQLNVDSNNIEIKNNCKTAAIKCFAYFQPFQMLSRHAEQVHEYISGQDKNLLNEDILQTWKDKIIKVINEGLDDIEDSMKLIFKNLREDVTTQIKPEFNKLLLQVNAYRQYLISNIFTISSSKVAATSDNLSTSMSTFIDLVPPEIFL